MKEDPDIEVVGLAANGKIALQKIPQTNPDILTMDVEMPEMDGLATLKELRKAYPKLPVIMFSTLTERGANATIDALTFGANDYVTKPANVGSVTIAQERVRADLIAKIRALAGGPVVSAKARAAAMSSGSNRPNLGLVAAANKAPSKNSRIDCVAIGVSTGGPNALLELMPTFPADFPVPIVIVQHMPPVFTKALADRLNDKSPVAVREAAAGDRLAAGTVYIAPGGHHMVLRRYGNNLSVDLNDDPPENSCRPAVDVLFRSVAANYGPHALAVVLTGMGQDGMRGCESIKDAGGDVFVQDEATSVVWGMPGFVADAGLANRIVPLQRMGSEIQQRVFFSRTTPAAVKVEKSSI